VPGDRVDAATVPGCASASGATCCVRCLQMALDARSTVRLCGDEAIRLFSPSIDVRCVACRRP